ncbi:MAG TPA: FAD-dependent monooxygenase [Trebonia sp.]
MGAGPAGLYFAILAKLRDPRDSVTVFERQAQGTSYGWGVTFVPALLRKLYASDPESARSIEQAALRWRDQFVDIHEMRMIYDGGVDVYNLNRPRLVEILTRRARQLGVPIEYGREISHPGQLPEADLIVAADGAGSRLRQSAGDFGTVVVQDDAKYIWLGTDRPFGAFAYHFRKTAAGWIWASSYGVESGLSTFVVHCAGRTWRGLGFDTMPPAETLAALRGLYAGELAGHRLMGQLDDETSARWQSFRTVTNEHWYQGKVVLVGDSGHTTHFTVGEGTTLALEDASALAGSLRRHGAAETALPAYERQRQAEIRHSQQQARRSARFFASIPRYATLAPEEFGTLLHARRSPLLPLLPPRLYYQLHRASRQAPLLRQLRPVARALKHRLQPPADISEAMNVSGDSGANAR